jgi:hypothetical protein
MKANSCSRTLWDNLIIKFLIYFLLQGIELDKLYKFNRDSRVISSPIFVWRVNAMLHASAHVKLISHLKSLPFVTPERCWRRQFATHSARRFHGQFWCCKSVPVCAYLMSHFFTLCTVHGNYVAKSHFFVRPKFFEWLARSNCSQEK